MTAKLNIHVVQRGDTLWGLAGKLLGDNHRWPDIYHLNNEPAVVAVTKARIADPDLIFVGQRIAIPSYPVPSPKTQGAKQTVPSIKTTCAPKKPARRSVRGIAFKYNLKDLPSITVASPTYIATVSLKGSVTLQNKDPIDFVTVTSGGYEISAKREADIALGKLISDTQVGYSAKTKEISLEIGLSIHSKGSSLPTTKATVAVSTRTRLPVLKGTITAKEIRGEIDGQVYLASNLSCEVELTPRPPTAKPRERVPARRPVRKPKPGWDYVVGGALVVGAGLIIVGTIVEDIVTWGGAIWSVPKK